MFLDESGFLLIPNVRNTWAPRGRTPQLWHLYKRLRLSAISALTVSPSRRRMGLYARFHSANITGLEVVTFLRHLLRHLRGPVALLWDGGPIHKRRCVQDFVRRHPRLRVHRFPAYAPELNPDEFVSAQAKRALSNSAPRSLRDLRGNVHRTIRKIRTSQALLRSCVHASELPWP